MGTGQLLLLDALSQMIACTNRTQSHLACIISKLYQTRVLLWAHFFAGPQEAGNTEEPRRLEKECIRCSSTMRRQGSVIRDGGCDASKKKTKRGRWTAIPMDGWTNRKESWLKIPPSKGSLIDLHLMIWYAALWSSCDGSLTRCRRAFR